MTIDRLRATLTALGPPPDPLELAEMLWLACHVPGWAPDHLDSAERTVGPADLGPGQPDEQTGLEALADPAGPDELHLPAEPPPAGTDAKAILVPTSPLLRDTLGIQRALRPLKRGVDSRRYDLIDETATAERIAEQSALDRLWLPVLRSSPERWLSLALVVDAGPSMRMWQPLAAELAEALTRLGAFSDVRTWHWTKQGVASTSRDLPHHPATLLDPAARRLILVLSDCSGPYWWEGSAERDLRTWAGRGPVAILQPLPERLWRRTAAAPVPGLARLPYPGAPNTDLRFVPYEGDPPADGVPVPVLEISRTWLGDWARLVTTGTGGGLPTAIFWAGEGRKRSAPVEREHQLSPLDRVRRFQATASPEAVRLAAHIAVSVPALPVMQLIQHRLVGDSGPGHLAEVVLSGLLRPTSRPEMYEFVPGTREALLTIIPRSESWYAAQVLTQISAEIAARAGSATRHFRAYLSTPEGQGDHALADNPFALVNPQAHRFLTNTAIPTLDTPHPEPEPTEIQPAEAEPAETTTRVSQKADEKATGVAEPSIPDESVAESLIVQAHALSRLATEQAEQGDNDSAAASNQEATDLYRNLAESSPAHLPDLAQSLFRLGICLSRLGRHDEALLADREAVQLRGRLAETESDRHLPDLADALNSVGADLTNLGRPAAALSRVQESVGIYRHLAETAPDQYLPDLGRSLHRVASLLSQLGRHDEALTAGQEAVRLHRQLAETAQERYLRSLGYSLEIFGALLSAVGFDAEAMAVTEEAVDIYRRLAESDPDEYLPDLASGLNNLGFRFASLGRDEEALTATEQATGAYRPLAQTDPDQHLPNLALGLHSLVVHLTKLGRYEEALTATREAVDIYGRLVETDSDQYHPYLARALYSLGLGLGNVGRHEEALTTTEQAIGAYRRLAQTDPDQHLPTLAHALNSLGTHLAKLRRHADALTANQDAVRLRRQLAETDPRRYLPQLAFSLESLGLDFENLRRHSEALAATQEATDIRRQLVELDPEEELPRLADSLEELASRFSALGQPERAREALAEAAAINTRIGRSELEDTARPSGFRTIFVCDIVGFGEHAGQDRVQEYLHLALYRTLKAAFDASGIPFDDCYREDRGDGVMIVLPADADAALLISPLVDHLRAEVRRANRLASGAAMMRLRVALHRGRMRSDAEGLVGTTVNHVFRLLDAPGFKQAMTESTADVGVLASTEFHTAVIQDGHGATDPAQFRPLDVQAKETRTTAWIHVPDALHEAVSSHPAAVIATESRTGDSPPPTLFELVGKILAIPAMASAEGRDRLVSALPQEIAIRIQRSARPHLDMHAIVRICLDVPGGIEEFLSIVRSFAGDSLQMRALDETIASITRRRG